MKEIKTPLSILIRDYLTFKPYTIMTFWKYPFALIGLVFWVFVVIAVIKIVFYLN